MVKKEGNLAPNRSEARKRLEDLWNAALLNDELAPEGIITLVNSKQTAIRYCLPTQLLGKLVGPDLNALSLQKGDGTAGRWDPRGFAAKVIVPWNQANQNVLGKSGDPYVSNPLRRPQTDHGLSQLEDREQWDRLNNILSDVQNRSSPSYTEEILRQVLAAIRDRLRELSFDYIVPPRVSLKQARNLARDFLSEKSGGDRGLAVVAALFETFNDKVRLYKAIRRGVINAADAATSSAGDIECVDDGEKVVLAIEVKERLINNADVQYAVLKAREQDVRELLLCTSGVGKNEETLVNESFESAWASGTSLYHLTIDELIRSILPIIGEASTRTFITKVGKQLDEFSSQPRHRKAWKSLLDSL